MHQAEYPGVRALVAITDGVIDYFRICRPPFSGCNRKPTAVVSPATEL